MIRSHLRSNVIGYVALFVALTAGAYAAGLKKNSVTSKAIKNGGVTRADLAANSVDSSKVADGSLTAGDFGGTLPQGEQGPPGPPGSPDTGAEILAKLDEVAGPGSGLDADYVDGLSSQVFVKANDTPGGELSGTYANPGIADGVVGVDETATLPAARVDVPLDSASCTGYPALTGDNTIEAVAFSEEAFDTLSLHSTTCAQSSRLVAVRAGVYEIDAGVTWANFIATNPATGTRFAGIRLNGDNDRYVTASRISGLPGNQAPEQSLSTMVRMDQGDYAELMVAQDSGSPITIDGGFERQSFSMAWIAP